MWVVEVYPHSFLTLALDVGKWEIFWILHSKLGQLTKHMNIVIKNAKSNVYENMQCSDQDVPDSSWTALAFSGIWLRCIINILYYAIDNVFS